MSIVYGADGILYKISQHAVESAQVVSDIGHQMAASVPVTGATTILSLNDLYASAPLFGIGP